MKKRIMVVDDDAAIVDAVTMILELEGYEVISILDGTKVTNSLHEKPDLMLLDIWMSGIDGATICRHLKGDHHTCNIPVIMISANRDTQKIASECGADDFIPKPFDVDNLLDKVKRFTSAHPRGLS